MRKRLRNKEGKISAIAVVGTTVSEELCEQSSACSVAGNKYQLGFVGALEEAFGQPVHVVSVWPVAMYPRSRTILSPRAVYRVGKLSTASLVRFVNVPILKQCTILLALFKHLCVWLWRERKSDSRTVFVYNVFAPFSLAVLGATTLLGGRCVAIVADLPYDVYDFKGVVRGLLQRIDFYVQTHSIARFAGVISLTRRIAQDFAPGLPALVVEGGVESDGMKQIDARSAELMPASPMDERIILYSGTLNDINGIDLLISAFRLLDDGRYRLHIFGRGPMELLVREAAAQDKRILYTGVLPNTEIRQKQAQATCLINPRPSYREITRYTFPSKLLEYLASGRPTITTALPGIPEEYYPYVFVVRDETPEGLALAIQGVCEKTQAELTEFGKNARDFVLGEKSWTRQGVRIHEFLCSLQCK